MRRDAGNYGEPRAVEHDPGQPEMTTVASNHGDNGDAAAASEADNLGVDTGHERRRGEGRKGALAHHELNCEVGEVGESSTATKSASACGRCRGGGAAAN